MNLIAKSELVLYHLMEVSAFLVWHISFIRIKYWLKRPEFVPQRYSVASLGSVKDLQ